MKLNMKLLNNDFFVLGLSAVIITTFSVLLYADFTRKIEVSGVTQIGTITFKRQVAQRKYQAQVVWEDVKQSYPVYNNDSIRTSDESEAVINLHDGTDISVDENSMIMLSMLDGGININFAHGAISANRQNVAGDAALTIITSGAAVSIDRGNIQLAQLENKELDLTVSEGSASVKTDFGESVVNVNEQAIISSDKKEARIVPFKIDLTSPDNNSFVVTDSASAPVKFKWAFSEKSMDEANLQIAYDREFEKIKQTKRIAGLAEASEQLGPGIYYWRLSALNRASGKTEFSELRKLNIIYSAPAKPLAPLQGESVSSFLSNSSVAFSWSENEMASGYTLEVSDTRDFSNILQTVDTPMRRIALENIEPGVYFWRVKSKINAGGKEIVMQGNPTRFIVENKVAAVSKPEEIRPEEVLIEEPVPEKLKSFLVVNSPVKGSRIYIDSKLQGRDSIKYEVKSANEIFVTVRAAGYKDYIQKITVPEGKTVTISPALDKSDLLKRIKWIYSADSPLAADPVYSKGKIVTAYENGVIAVLSSSGNLILSAKLAKRFESRPVVSNDNAYILDVDGMLFSFNLVTGKTAWKVQAKGPLLLKCEPVIADERIYFATGYGNVEAYNLKGEKLWEKNLDEAVFSSVQVHKDVLIVATDALKVYALRISDGKIIWDQKIDGRVITAGPLVTIEGLYFGTQAGSFYALAVNSGEVFWKFQANGSVYSTPVLIKDKVYFGTENGLFYAVSKNTGGLVWSHKTDKGIKGNPLFAFSNIMVSDEKSVYSFNPENGSIKWSATFETAIKTSPVFAGDVVVMGLANGEVVSVRDNLVQTVR